MKCSALRNIPERKIQETLKSTIQSCEVCSKNGAGVDDGLCQKCSTINKAFLRYAGANIPVKYWKLSMLHNFTGDPVLLDTYKEITADLKKTYMEGTCLCFAGSFGVGKTMCVCEISKRFCEKGYSVLFVTLSDIISATASDEKHQARNELLSVDVLCVDELDGRYMASGNASDYFGRVLEDLFRARSQNCLPTFFCTNAPDLLTAFSGIIQGALTSLMNEVRTIFVLGEDYRKNLKKEQG